MPSTQARAGRRDEVRTLALACLITALVVGITVAVPFSPTAPRALGVVLTVVGLALAGLLYGLTDRVRPRHVHEVLALATALISLSVAVSTTPAGTVVTSVSYLWVALFSALHHRRRVLLRHLAGIGAGLAAGLWWAGAASPGQTWFFLMMTFGWVAVVINSRVGLLRAEATTDALTGALSRRAFRAVAELEMARAARTGQPLTLVVVDLDDFKLINDAQGHSTGDDVLVGLVRSWRTSLRAEDALGRFGGDEFTLLLPRTDGENATGVLARLSDDLCSWSSGVATWVPGDPFDTWFAHADRNLYEVKSGS